MKQIKDRVLRGFSTLLIAVLLLSGTGLLAASDETTDASAETTGTDAPDTEAVLPVFYVAQGGTGDGSAASSPSGDIADGFRALSETGGTIRVSGTLDLRSSGAHDGILGVFVEPEHKGAVTVEGDGSAVFSCGENYRIYLSGQTEYRRVGFEGSGALIVAARCHPVAFGEGIVFSGLTDGVCLLGGFNGSGSGIPDESTGTDPSITIESGDFRYVVGFNRGTTGKNFTGCSRVIVRGGHINVLLAGLAGGNMSFRDNVMGGMHVTLLGGTVYKIGESDTQTFGTLGSFTLDYTGGTAENILLSPETDATLNYTGATASRAAAFLRYFDRSSVDGKEPTQVRALRVACVGDSITMGAGTADPEKESYPAQLGEMLGNGYEVRNYGEGGKMLSASSASGYIYSDTYRESREYLPDTVLIMLGTNDLPRLKDDAGAAAVLRTDLISLIKSYTDLDSHPVIYLLSPTPRTDDGELDAALRNTLLPLLSSVCEETHCGYVDLYTVLGAMPEHFPDAFHPDATACRTIATWLSAVIRGNSTVNVAGLQAVTPVEVIVRTPDGEDGGTPDGSDAGSDGTQKESRHTWVLPVGIGCMVVGAILCAVGLCGKERLIALFDKAENALTAVRGKPAQTDGTEEKTEAEGKTAEDKNR